MWQASEGLIAILGVVFVLGAIRAFSGNSRRKRGGMPPESVSSQASKTSANNREIDVKVQASASGNKVQVFPEVNDTAAHLAARGN
jgi:hypothetical protein